jgi:hypothetical protein
MSSKRLVWRSVLSATLSFVLFCCFFFTWPTPTLQGCFEANPPFTPFIMDRMAQHIEALLEASEREADTHGDKNDVDGDKSTSGANGSRPQKPLAFIVIIPAWDEAHNDRAIQQASAPSWKMCVCACVHALTAPTRSPSPLPLPLKQTAHQHQSNPPTQCPLTHRNKLQQTPPPSPCPPAPSRLRDSRFCARHVLLPALGHGYVEGNQQRLPTRWKTSAFDTSVFILQNAAARAKWPVTDEVCCACGVCCACTCVRACVRAWGRCCWMMGKGCLSRFCSHNSVPCRCHRRLRPCSGGPLPPSTKTRRARGGRQQQWQQCSSRGSPGTRRRSRRRRWVNHDRGSLWHHRRRRL